MPLSRAWIPAVIVASLVSLGGCAQVLGIGSWSGDAGPGDDADECSSSAACGVCGRTCHTVGDVCNAGSCAAAACVAGFDSCNAMASDGCETNVMTDAHHCGSCSRDCGGNACVDGVCEPTVFFQAIDPYIPSVAVRDGYLYWLQESPPEVRRAPVTGGPSELACPSPTSPRTLMVDSAGIYWLAINGSTAGTVLKCTSPPCAAPTILATGALGSDSPYNATSDASRIYWSSGGAPPGMRAVSKAGGGTSTVSMTGDTARGMLLLQGTLYFTDCCGTSTGLYAVPATGGTPAQLNDTMSGALTTFDNAIYTEEFGVLYRVTTAGAMTELDTHGAKVDSLAVDASGIYIYSSTLGGIARLPLTGGAPVLLGHANGVIQIALDENAVYWSENAVGPLSAVKRIPK